MRLSQVIHRRIIAYCMRITEIIFNTYDVLIYDALAVTVSHDSQHFGFQLMCALLTSFHSYNGVNMMEVRHES